MNIMAVIFDLYGTLIDIASLNERVSKISKTPDEFVQLWRDRQLALAFATSNDETYADFDELTARALDDTVARLQITIGGNARADILAGWTEVGFYADVAPTVVAIRERGYQTAVLTNGTARSARLALTNVGLMGIFDAVLTADTVHRYKPEEAVYRMALDHFHCAPDEILFVSSNDWDASGAARIGFRSIWCHRGAANSRRPERSIGKLDELLTILDTE